MFLCCILNIRYADDTTLVEMVFEKLQISTNAFEHVEDACHKWGMKITISSYVTQLNTKDFMK